MASAVDYFTDASRALNNKSDVVLVVEGDRFYCHRLLLSLVSPVFTRMFDGEFKEHNAQEIVLEGKTSDSILELLKYIYPQFHGQITNENLEDFLLLADEYMIEHLKQPCKEMLMKQLAGFEFALLPSGEKLVQRSLKSKSFHASDSALDSPRHPDDGSTPRIPSARRPTSSIRRPAAKSTSTYFKSSDRSNSSSDSQPRYILFLDKTRLPHFYDEHDKRVPFTIDDLGLWLRRLRILYQIDKGRDYGEVIDCVLSILQFVPASLLGSVLHITPETFTVDEMILNDIARARMYMLEEWTTDGDPYRRVKLTDSYRMLSPSVIATTAQRSISLSANATNDEQIPPQETVLLSADFEATALDFQLNMIDSD